MDRTGKLAIAMASALGVGCAGHPGQINGMSPDELAAYPPHKRIELCGAYGWQASENVKQELLKSIPDADWSAIDQDVVKTGMDKCEVLAAWGPPSRTYFNTIGVEIWAWNRHGLGPSRVTFRHGRVWMVSSQGVG
jgi:hypothetical protein